MIEFSQDGGQWAARVPQLGIAGYGETQGEALRNLAAVLDEENLCL